MGSHVFPSCGMRPRCLVHQNIPLRVSGLVLLHHFVTPERNWGSIFKHSADTFSVGVPFFNKPIFIALLSGTTASKQIQKTGSHPQ